MKPKPETRTPPAYHGAFDYGELARLGLSPDEVIDFSVNSNPYGPPPGVREAIARVPLDRYPDRDCLALREKLVRKHSVGMEQIVVGNGTAELLQSIAFAFLRPGDPALIVEPTFGEYERVARLMGGTIHTLKTDPPRFTIDPSTYRAAVQQARIVFDCHPNNPTGLASSAPDLTAEYPDTLFVVDRAYSDFALPQTQRTSESTNLISLYSLTKNYALAGLRLGYAIGAPDIIDAVRHVQPAWTVNALAQAAGLAALDADGWLRETVSQLHDHKRDLVTGLKRLGLQPLDSKVHYFLVHVGDGADFRRRLLKHKVMVRDCDSFGLPEYVRIATRTPDDNHKLLDAIAQV